MLDGRLGRRSGVLGASGKKRVSGGGRGDLRGGMRRSDGVVLGGLSVSFGLRVGGVLRGRCGG